MVKKIILVLILISVVGIATFLILGQSQNKFKEEYESLNNKENANGKKYIALNISEDNPIVYSNYDEIFKVLEDTGVIFFGFPKCPWCRLSIPVLLDAADETGLDKIYYLNNLSDRDILSLKDGNIITEKKATKNYKKLLQKLGDSAPIYDGLGDDNIKRLYFPTVVFVKNGKIIDYIDDVTNSKKDPYSKLTKSEKKELKEKYMSAMTEVMVCDVNENC